MYKEKVSLNINGLSNVFSNYKGQKIRLESDKSEKGWICLSVGENLTYDINLSRRLVRRHVPVVVMRNNLPSASLITREVILLISQLKDIGVPVISVEFTVGETGSPYLCSAFPGEYYILFEK